MDEIRRLQREIDRLENQLRRQNEAADRERSRLLEQNRDELRKYQANMQKAISQHDAETKYEYERLLSQYQSRLDGQVKSQLSAMSADYESLLLAVKHNEAELNQKNKELERAVAELKNDMAQRDEGNSREAADCQLGAVEAYRSIESMPHERFAPGRLNIFYSSIRDSQRLMKAGLFEAAAAVAISARTGLRRLGFTIDEKQAEWTEQYELFVMRLEYLEAKLNQLSVDWAELVGVDRYSDSVGIELNYWTRGDFKRISQSALNYRELADEVQRQGRAEYLKKQDGVSADQLKEYISDIQHLDELLSSSAIISNSRYEASCQRADWGESIIDFMQDELNLNLCVELTGFQTANAETLEASDFAEYIRLHLDESITEDMREWLRLVFENASGDRIYIYILPIEGNSRVINHIVIHIDYQGAMQEQYARDIYAHVCEAVGYHEESAGTVNYAEDINELKFSSNRAFGKTGEDIEKIKRQS